MKDSQRIYGLDILRATAILLVVVLHAGLFFAPDEEYLFRALPDGVTVFFVLSGFLIGGILLNIVNRTDFSFVQLRNFWYRRWLRTLPAYFAILILIILHRALMGYAGSNAVYVPFFFFVQNINDGVFYFFPESWSLSVEEWFYVLFPLLLFISLKLIRPDKKKTILSWIILAILFSVIIRLLRSGNIQDYAEWNRLIRKAVITRFDSIMAGFLGAFLFYYKYKIWERKQLLFVLGLLLLVLPCIVHLFSGYTWFTLYLRIPFETAGTLCLLPLLTQYRHGSGVVFRFLSFTSLISYSIYLLSYTPFREIVLPRLETWFGLPPTHVPAYDLIRLAVFLVWCFVGGWMLYILVERPFMRFRDKISSKR